jgi:hypothetical protein
MNLEEVLQCDQTEQTEFLNHEGHLVKKLFTTGSMGKTKTCDLRVSVLVTIPSG